MHTGELARGAQVNIQTIRFYEREGLLPRPERSGAGYRLYEARDLERVIFIKRNQELGFTLAEIKELLEIHRAFGRVRKPLRREMKEVQAIICLGRQRLVSINQKIRLLHDMRRSLSSVVQHLEGSKVATCPVGQTPPRKRAKKVQNNI